MTSTTKNPILTLIKYNCRFIYKQLIVFYFIIFGLTIIYCLTNFETSNFWIRFLHEFAQGATFGFALGMLINASLRMWAKYRYGVYGDESYLIHTLPLKRTTIWAANFLTSLVVLLISGVVFLICSIIVLPTSEYTLMLSDQNINFWTLFAVLCSSIFCQVTFIMQAGLTGINLGHLHNNNPVEYFTALSFI